AVVWRDWSSVVFCSSRRRHTRFARDWSSDVCSSDLSWGRRRETVLGPRSGKQVYWYPNYNKAFVMRETDWRFWGLVVLGIGVALDRKGVVEGRRVGRAGGAVPRRKRRGTAMSGTACV